MTNEAPKTPLGKKLLAIRNKAIANGMQLKTEEEIMTNDKGPAIAGAPTPEEVEKAKAQLSWVNKIDFGGDRDPPDVVAVRTLLAHISALEASVSNGKESCRAMASCLDRRDDRITALEAENKRLRDLLGGANYTYLGAEYVACLEPDAITAALAQTGEK